MIPIVPALKKFHCSCADGCFEILEFESMKIYFDAIAANINALLIVSCLQGDDGQPGQAGGDGVGGLAVSKYGQHLSSRSCIAHI